MSLNAIQNPLKFPLATRCLAILTLVCSFQHLHLLTLENVFHNMYVYTTVTGFFTQATFWSLFFALVCGYARLRRFEYETGTLGTFTWYLYAGTMLGLLHLLACSMMVFLGGDKAWSWVTHPSSGMWPLIAALYMLDAKKDFFEIFFTLPQPLGVHFYAGMAPFCVLVMAWITNDGVVPSDVMISLGIFGLVPPEYLEFPDPIQQAFEELGRYLEFIQTWECYVPRGHGGFQQLPVFQGDHEHAKGSSWFRSRPNRHVPRPNTAVTMASNNTGGVINHAGRDFSFDDLNSQVDKFDDFTTGGGTNRDLLGYTKITHQAAGDDQFRKVNIPAPQNPHGMQQPQPGAVGATKAFTMISLDDELAMTEERWGFNQPGAAEAQRAGTPDRVYNHMAAPSNIGEFRDPKREMFADFSDPLL